ncbi:hypothetical protein KQH62_00875 [bacterium]|nr:hypothetical protein [bacterium]
MPTTEHTINDAIASVLRKTRHAWKQSKIVKAENTGEIKGSNARPDIIINETFVSPVVVECEIIPAITVENEAKSRLGLQLRSSGKRIVSAIAVRIPERFKDLMGEELKTELSSTLDLEMAIFTGNGLNNYSRWPESGWVRGGISDLSIFAQSTSIPPEVIEKATDELIDGVSDSAGLLSDIADEYSGALEQIGKELCQEDDEQTRRMASTILVNALIFQDILAGGEDELASIRSLEQLRDMESNISKHKVLKEWRKILQINYWPIFDIARRILEAIPTQITQPMINLLAETAESLLQTQLMNSHDLTGALFQKLISDRKFLAAFYTTPPSSALLAGLTINQGFFGEDGSWSNGDDIKSLRIADFACGTGTLLSTVYKQITQLHELASGDAELIHPEMMSKVLVGCDVLPAAAHLTASSLAGAFPKIKYEHSLILTIPYGRQPDGSVALGSLNLLEPQAMFAPLSITAKASTGMGEEERELWKTLPHESFDVVIMNPPFTRATGHEGSKIGVPNPMFAAFGSTETEQKLMAAKTKKLTQDTSAHGNAGEASIFLALADRKVKEDGKLGLVMPLTLLSGSAWEQSRQLLRKNYRDLIVVSITGEDDSILSFSADTDMGECLIIGKKLNDSDHRGIFVFLKERPDNYLTGIMIANLIMRKTNLDEVRRIEDGPVGGTAIKIGDDLIGEMVSAPLPESGAWKLSRIADVSLAQTAHKIIQEHLIYLPTMRHADKFDIPITTISKIGELGPYHADVNGYTSSGGIRGPFNVESYPESGEPTYPILWGHDADRERTIKFKADSEGIIRQGKTPNEENLLRNKVEEIWDSATHCHFNRDFRFNSQSTCTQYTSRRTIGGRAWLSIKFGNENIEKIIALWGNTTMGILLYWWHSSKQQSGRGTIGKVALRDLPVLDVRKFSPEQIEIATSIFDEFADKKLLPIHEIAVDENRKLLDIEFLGKVLNFPKPILADGGPLDILRKKLGKEPSIRGTK